MSAVAANRKQFFDLVNALEKQGNCEIDELELQAEIDGTHQGKVSLTDAETRDVLLKVSKKPARRARGGG